jgi:hypothetical protein
MEKETPYTVTHQFAALRVRSISSLSQGRGLSMDLESSLDRGQALRVVFPAGTARELVEAMRSLATRLESVLDEPPAPMN